MMVRIHYEVSVGRSSKLPEDAGMRKLAWVHTMRSKTCRNMAAAPLKPPPRALFSAPLRSNCKKTLVFSVPHYQVVDTDIDILGVYPPLDEDSEKQSRQYCP